MIYSELVGKGVVPSGGIARMKRKLVAILSTIVVGIMLGYLFLLSLFLGFLASKYAAGKSAGERGKVRSIIIPFGRRRIHLHHWLYSLWLIGFSSITGMYFLTPTITYGLLGGSAFQGVYCYGDWHIILISRYQTKAREHSLDASRNKTNSESRLMDAPGSCLPSEDNTTL